MMMKDLCLIQPAERTEFKDGSVKMKHLFIDEENKAYTGWTDEGQELSAELSINSDKYNKDRARAYVVVLSEYDGKLRSKVDLSREVSEVPEP